MPAARVAEASPGPAMAGEASPAGSESHRHLGTRMGPPGRRPGGSLNFGGRKGGSDG